MEKSLLTRTNLYNHHRLSHQQIDAFLGESEAGRFLMEKLGQLELVAEFITLTDIFRAAGIEFISLKGPLLSYRIYGDATTRWYNDLDFLLSWDDMQKAIKLLQEQGYQPMQYRWPDRVNHQLFLKNFANQFFMFHPVKNHSIELHWNLFKDSFIKPEKLSEIIGANQTSITFAGRTFSVFTTEFELLYLVIHGGLHAWRRLKWLFDVNAMLTSQTLDSQKFAELVNTMHARRLTALCNVLLKRFFQGGPMLPQTEKAFPFMVKYSLNQIEAEQDVEYTTAVGSLKFRWFLMKCFPGWTYKISILKQSFLSIHLMNEKKISQNTFLLLVYGLVLKLKR